MSDLAELIAVALLDPHPEGLSWDEALAIGQRIARLAAAPTPRLPADDWTPPVRGAEGSIVSGPPMKGPYDPDAIRQRVEATLPAPTEDGPHIAHGYEPLRAAAEAVVATQYGGTGPPTDVQVRARAIAVAHLAAVLNEAPPDRPAPTEDATLDVERLESMRRAIEPGYPLNPYTEGESNLIRAFLAFIDARSAPITESALAERIAATKGSKEDIEALYDGVSWLDAPQEWFDTPRDLAAAILKEDT